MEISEFYHILFQLGKAPIQQYVIKLGRYYWKLFNIQHNDIKEPTNAEVIEKGARILERMFDLDIVTKEYQTTNDFSVSYVLPLIDFEENYEKIVKEYPILTTPPTLDLQYTRIGKLLCNISTKNTLSTFSKSNEKVVDILSNTPILVNSSYSHKHRNPKNGVKDINYENQTRLFRRTLKENENKKIYFFWQYDSRGRVYPKGYTLNPHGDQWQKVQLEFYNKEKVNDKGLVWLKRDIANNYGLDLEDHSVKEQWFDSNESNILNKNKNFLAKAKDKLLVLRAIDNYKLALDDKPIGLPISLDVTSSSIQLMSLLARDENGCMHTNLTGENKRNDIYLHMTYKLASKLGKEINREKAISIRKVIKQCAMIHTYNGKSQIYELIPDEHKRKLFFEVLFEECKGAIEVQNILNNAFEEIKDYEYLEWSLPDGLNVNIPQITHEYLKFKTRYFNVSFKMDKIGCDYKQNCRMIAPNVIHSIDAYINRQMILRAKSDILPIHDNFQIHPNYADETLRNYNTILNEISHSDLLGDIVRSITKNKFVNPFLTKTPINTLDSKYSIC